MLPRTLALVNRMHGSPPMKHQAAESNLFGPAGSVTSRLRHQPDQPGYGLLSTWRRKRCLWCYHEPLQLIMAGSRPQTRVRVRVQKLISGKFLTGVDQKNACAIFMSGFIIMAVRIVETSRASRYVHTLGAPTPPYSTSKAQVLARHASVHEQLSEWESQPSSE